MFVIPCKLENSNNIIQQCVSSIKLHMPDQKIAVYYNSQYIEIPNTITRLNNKNYFEGALWSAYSEFPDEEFYYCIHDSTVLNKSLKNFSNNNLTTVRYFNSSPFSYSGFGNQENLDWATKHLNEIGIDITKDYLGVFGPMFLISRDLLDLLHQMKVSNILPKNKEQSSAMERVWGIIFNFIKVDVTNSIQGKLNGLYDSYDETYLKKLYFHRN